MHRTIQRVEPERGAVFIVLTEAYDCVQHRVHMLTWVDEKEIPGEISIDSTIYRTKLIGLQPVALNGYK